ncbi:hypothetical protein FJZ31_10510 [Candidatus Poribacteria bacterium]|nr:hypothetical protein [Candidatus Poribacteria bacterium]
MCGKNDYQTYWIFISGSKMPNQPSDEIDRFCQICEAIGKALAGGNYGLVGCPPHWERVLASQHAKKGLHSVKPNAPFSTEGLPENRLFAEDRIRFVKVANAAVFIGGSSGTMEEFELCRSYHVKPLIPVAGAGGTGAKLAKQLLYNPKEFCDYEIDEKTIATLTSTDEEPERYAQAVVSMLVSAKEKDETQAQTDAILTSADEEPERYAQAVVPMLVSAKEKDETQAQTDLCIKNKRKWWQFWRSC